MMKSVCKQENPWVKMIWRLKKNYTKFENRKMNLEKNNSNQMIHIINNINDAL